MTEEIVDGYEDLTELCPEPGGENLIRINPDGTIENLGQKPLEEHPNKWKDSQKIMASSDDAIWLLRVSETGTYYMVCGSTVKYRGKGNGEDRQYLCLKPSHRCNECPHTRRLAQWLADHSSEKAA